MARISTIFIGLVVFCAIIFAFSGVIGNMTSNYNVTIDQQFFNTYQKINQTATLAIGIQQNVTGQEIQSSGFFDTISNGAYKLLRLVMNLIPLVNNVIQDTLSASTNAIGLPEWVGTIVMLMFLLTLIFLIIAAVLRDFSRSV